MRQRNGFDSLRLIGSLMVMVGHAFIITGATAPHIGTISLHSFGVCIFFSISGFLIAQSWMSDRSWPRFVMRRLLRLVPALFVVTAASAVVIGAVATSQPLPTYFRHGWTWWYVVSNTALVTVWNLPGVFEGLPLHGQVNGSLWTLPIEFLLYLVTPVLVLLCHRGRAVGPLLLVAAAIMFLLAVQATPGVATFTFHGIDVGRGLELFPYFWIGVALRLLDLGAWSTSRKRAVGVSAFLIFAAWAAVAHPTMLPVGIVSIAVLVLSVGLAGFLHSDRLSRLGDPSYGIYLWAFPIQQLVFQKVGGGAFVNLAISAPVTIGIAYGSWHLVERPALRFKPRRRRAPEEEHDPASSIEALQSPS